MLADPIGRSPRLLALVATALAVFLSGCAGAPGVSAAGDCSAPSAQVSGSGDSCTVYREFRSADGAGDAEIERLIVFLHGDMSSGHDDYMHVIGALYAERFNAAGVRRFVVQSPLRRGYKDGLGNRSSGRGLTRDLYRVEVIDQMQAFLADQKARFPNARVTLVGHSGGAAVAGVIAGRAPQLADNFILAGSPGNIGEWRRRYRTNSAWPQSLSPHSFAATTRPDQTFHVVGSPRDDSTPLPLGEEQVALLRSLGRSADLLVLEDARHNQLVRRTETIRLIAQSSAPD